MILVIDKHYHRVRIFFLFIIMMMTKPFKPWSRATYLYLVTCFANLRCDKNRICLNFGIMCHIDRITD